MPPISSMPSAVPQKLGSGEKDSRFRSGGSSHRLGDRPNVLTRIHSLFPGYVKPSRMPGSSVSFSTCPQLPPPIPTRPAAHPLKVKIISWNMHDSLPKGNLEDLLGVVPPYVPRPEGETDKFSIPNVALEDCHPYHIVVVAGQECPTVSKIPMGLAASFRHGHGDKKEKHKSDEKAGKKKKDVKDNSDSDTEVAQPNGATLTPVPQSDNQSTSGHTSGWSWILEEWFCNGFGQRGRHFVERVEASSNVTNSNSDSVASEHTAKPIDSRTVCENLDCIKTRDQKKKEKLLRKCCCKPKESIGPYELLTKERLMGIYLAVFIYRDLKPLVKGISKSSVTTGLIGGRVGNKGGVGISINLDGTTLLFMNAHLAAHEDRVMSRVANMAKIKSELQVNDFLDPEDERIDAEDLTDKFDYTFLFGDLNFRLDVSRLHADWMISRRDFNQALTFDQLRALMKDGKAFVGFHEATINFPPTFKYDVVKSARREKTQGHAQRDDHPSALKRWKSPASFQNLSEVQETYRSGDERDGYVTDDAASFDSAAISAASSRSRLTSFGQSSDLESSRGLTRGRKVSKSRSERTNGDMNPIQNLFTAASVLKARKKWLSLLKPSSSTTLQNEPQARLEEKERLIYSSSTPQIAQIQVDLPNPVFNPSPSISEMPRAQTPTMVELRRTSSRRSTKSNQSGNMLSIKGTDCASSRQEVEGGVYDTSAKQRVPSWCDRILWKSTIEIDDDSDDEMEPEGRQRRNSGLGPRMRAFLSQAMRPISRMRTGSFVSSGPYPSTSAPPSQMAHVILSTPRWEDSERTSATAPILQSITSHHDTSLSRVKSLVPHPTRKSSKAELKKSKSIGAPVSVPHWKHKRRRRSNTALPAISPPISASSIPNGHPATAPLAAAPTTRSLVESPQVDFSLTLPAPTPLGQNVTSPPILQIPGHRPRTGSMRAWRFFPSLFGRDDGETFNESPLEMPTPDREREPPILERQPRRGKVKVMSYRSLDDQEMWRLEGRSDHRPVIGGYVVYI